MGRKPTVRTSKLITVAIEFEQEVKASITSLKNQDKDNKIAIEDKE